MHPFFLHVGIPVASAAAVVLGWQRFGWQGVLAVFTLLVLWLLMHFNRTMQVLRRAAERPVGYVDSAVMLNAKLRPGVTLLHVTAMTRSLGALQSVQDTQPEVYRWSDNGHSWVDCTFHNGRLLRWAMTRTAQDDAPAAAMPPGKIAGSGSAVGDEGHKAAAASPNPGAPAASDNKD